MALGWLEAGRLRGWETRRGQEARKLESWEVRVLMVIFFSYVSSVGLILAKSADIVGGGAWGRRPHTASESTMLMSYNIYYSL